MVTQQYSVSLDDNLVNDCKEHFSGEKLSPLIADLLKKWLSEKKKSKKPIKKEETKKEAKKKDDDSELLMGEDVENIMGDEIVA
jgi:hypothetical protein